MIKFDILTIFPHILDSYLKEGILARAQKQGLVKINFHNLRSYTSDKHKTTDDKPFGGGPGMVMMIGPICKALDDLSAQRRTQKAKCKKRIILLSPRGKTFNQKTAKRLSKYNQLILICGRYEGVDERVAKYLADEVISIGDYVLSGGELPALVITEAVARLIPGVLGNEESLASESHESQALDFPHYTRPAEFKTKEGKVWKVPKVLISGNHKKIEEWRTKHRLKRN